jgi:hypothetical protein
MCGCEITLFHSFTLFLQAYKSFNQTINIAIMYQVELVWNREFHYVPYGDPLETINEARKYASDLRNMGDGARVKKTQIRDEDTGEIVL